MLSVGKRDDNQVQVVAVEVVKKYRNDVHNAAIAIALIMRGSDIEAVNMVVVSYFTIVCDGRIKGTVLTAADAAHGLFIALSWSVYC